MFEEMNLYLLNENIKCTLNTGFHLPNLSEMRNLVGHECACIHLKQQRFDWLIF